jgi:hypothetical protein
MLLNYFNIIVAIYSKDSTLKSGLDISNS